MAKVLVLYYSAYGHIEKMANAVAEGAREAGAHVLGEQRPKDQAVALGDRLVGGGDGAGRGIVSGDPDPLAAGVEQGEVGRVQHRLAKRCVAARQWHQHRDPIAGLIGWQARVDPWRLGPKHRLGRQLHLRPRARRAAGNGDREQSEGRQPD